MLLFLQENVDTLTDVVSEEKTLSIYKLITESGTAGLFIIGLLFVLLVIALYIYFERFFAVKAPLFLSEKHQFFL